MRGQNLVTFFTNAPLFYPKLLFCQLPVAWLAPPTLLTFSRKRTGRAIVQTAAGRKMHPRYVPAMLYSIKATTPNTNYDCARFGPQGRANHCLEFPFAEDGLIAF